MKLSEIAEVKLGRQRSPKNHTGDSMRRYLRAANVGWTGLLLDDVKSMNFTDAEMMTFRLRPGDLLLSEGSGSPKEVGKPALWNGELEDCAFQNTLLRVRPQEGVDSRYLNHYFSWQASTGAFARGSRGVGIHHLGREALAAWPIPLPTIEKQGQIVAILDKVHNIKSKRCQVVAHLEDVVRSTFHHMFGRVSSGRWEQVALGDVVTRIESGTSPVCESRPATEKEWGVLKLGAVTYGEFQEVENKAYRGDIGTMISNEVCAGDVLMTRKNTRDLVGAVALVDEIRPHLLLPDLIFRLHLKVDQIDRRYFHSLMMHPVKRSNVRDLSSGSAASMPNISKARLTQLPIELPPIALQREFASKVKVVALQRTAVQRALEADEDLFSSLQSRAFRGEL
ncbi:restriction endonuclease subunit S [Pseudonocardia sp.]|uniref:restriction endonuclease subunit S n=1 Tax=Pseudonocardia sp. TaxID=60912 RepID=UPI00262E1E64|nr:restriction endonuclease subunit S [Pseudonocardia sp.]